MQQLETEVKLEVEPGWSVPDLTGVLPGTRAANLPTLVLQTTYYDTDDMRLGKQLLALRFRHEGRAPTTGSGPADSVGPGEHVGEDGPVEQTAKEVWTLKLPSPDDGNILARTEVTWEPDHTGAESEGESPTVHREVARLLCGVTLGRDLRPIARLEALRRRTELRTSDGRLLAEIDYDTVTGTNLVGALNPSSGQPADDGAPSAVFTEVEVELAEGGALEVLDAVVARLLESGAHESSRRSKLTTVLQLAPTPNPSSANPSSANPSSARPSTGGHRPEAPRRRRTACVADVLREQAGACLAILLGHDPSIRLRDPDVEHVHKSRVAARRLRSVMRAFAPLVVSGPVPAGDEAETWFAHLDQELRWLAQALGGARDADVRLGTLNKQCAALSAADAPGAACVLDAAQKDQKRAHEALLEAMNSPRYMELLRTLEALGEPAPEPRAAVVVEPPHEVAKAGAGNMPKAAAAAVARDAAGHAEGDRASYVAAVPAQLWASLALPASSALPLLGRRQWRSLRRAVDRLGRHPTNEDLHRVRIRAKRMRYVAEVSAPNLASASDRRAAAYMANEATALQDVLGEVHDAAVNEQWLREVPARVTSATGRAKAAMVVATAMAAGQLIAAVKLTERSNRDAWPEHWERLRRKRLRAWMDGK